MCGLAGVYKLKKISAADKQLVQTMNQLQQHRGPDDDGLWSDDTCVLGHRRLSIIDLSAAGRQPFASDDGRYQIIFNGEIYNYIELKNELKQKGHVFKTATDTEVLLKCWQVFGIDCLSKFNGMFAIAIYDKQTHALWLARDRVGVKPLYYVQRDNQLYFASEIKALRAIPNLSLSTDQSALFNYLCFNRTDIFDETFHNEVKRLPKGHWAKFDSHGLTIKQWWNPEDFYLVNHPESPEEIYKNIEDLLVSSVTLRMRSDVEVGSCLSGGLDSSIITGIIFQKTGQPKNYKTFTASFPGFKIDETAYVDKLQQRYPFINLRTFPKGNQALEDLERFVYYNDEPTTSPTFYSQYQVMKLAKEQGVTVLLDGQGGDENFAGYQYFHGFNFTGLYKQKKFGRLAVEILSSALRKQEREAFQTFLFQILPDKIKKKLLLQTLPHVQSDFFHQHIDQSVIYNKFFTADNLNLSLVRHFQYKLEHLLRMEDRNSMAFSLEARVPYLDYRLIEYVLGIPAELKIKKGENKILQKKALGQYTIPEILNRKDKIGFGTPGKVWLQDPAWQKLTSTNYSFLTEKFPDIFKVGAKLPDNLFERWKVNQLATWLKMVEK